MFAEQSYGQRPTYTLYTLQHTCAHQNRECLQASDFMNDEEGTKVMCRHAAHWLFESPGSMLSRPDQASDRVASQNSAAASEERTQVRCFCVCSGVQSLDIDYFVCSMSYGLQLNGDPSQAATVDLVFMGMV